jgi:phosphatidate cytidylyltransferase
MTSLRACEAIHVIKIEKTLLMDHHVAKLLVMTIIWLILFFYNYFYQLTFIKLSLMLMNTELLHRIITGALIGVFLGAIYFFMPPIIFSMLLFVFLIFILLFEMPRLLSYKKMSSWVITLVYPTVPFLILISLNQSNDRILVFFIFILTFAHDIGAYFVGKLFGKHKLLPSISPKKTWEGFFGGTLSVFLVLQLLLIFYHRNHTIAPLFFFSLILSITATMGDLFESWLKRKACIKDSGTLLPGHGGLLDRFDSILFVTVLIYCFKDYISNCFY